MGDVIDVEPARGDVGRDENLRGVLAKTTQHAIALFLREAAVNRFGLVAASAERLGQLVDLRARAAEDDRRRRHLHIEHAGEGRGLVLTLHDVRHLAHARTFPRRDGLVGDGDVNGVTKMSFGDGEDAASHRGGEERRLPFAWNSLENLLELLGEAHVEHLVGFVEDERLDRAQRERRTADMVERASWRRDDDVDATTQRAKLELDGLAAVDRENARVERAAVPMHRFGDLHRELACRDENQSARSALVGLRASKDDASRGSAKAAVFPGPRRRLPKHVAAMEQRRNGLALDLRRLFIA